MSDLRQSIEITLLGQRIPFKSKDSDPLLVRQAADLVSGLIASAEERSPKGTAPHKITLLALLELAEKYLRAQRGIEGFQREVAEQAVRAGNLLESLPRT